MVDSQYINTSIFNGFLVSQFEHMGIKRPKCIKLIDALNSFKDGTYHNKIRCVRNALNVGNYDEYSVLKSQLPAITFCGKFEGGHKKENLSTYNYFLIIDIDKLENMEMPRIKECLLRDNHVFAFWESPSKKGLKGLIPLSFDQNFTFEESHAFHKYAFRIIAEYFLNTYKITLDSSGSDVSRLCFVSSDPGLVIKDKCLYFFIETKNIGTIPPIIKPCSISQTKNIQNASNLVFDKRHRNPLGKNQQKHSMELRLIIKYLAKKGLSITSTYENWYRVGYAIANTFSCDVGEKFYLKLCRLDGLHHDEDRSKKMLIYCYDNSKGNINFGTIIHLAQELGYKRDGSEGG